METTPDAIALLRELVEAQAETNALLRRIVGQREPAFDRSAELLAAIRDDLGAGCPFTSSGLLDLADREPHSAIGTALAQLIDLGTAGRAVALGKLLAGCDALERTRKAGVLLYRLGDE